MITDPFNGWIPGVLSKRQVQILCDEGFLQGVENPQQIDYSSLDLTLSREGYLMSEGAVKPFGDYERFLHALKESKKAISVQPDANGVFRLNAKSTYVFRLEQKLGPRIRKSSFYGQATAKSSVGRVDVLARLIVDGMDTYECFTPDGVNEGNGHLYVEITPITFPVLVKAKMPITQLRLFFGRSTECEVTGKDLFSSVLINSSGDGSLSVDLDDIEIGGSSGCAFKATDKEESEPIPLWTAQDLPKPDPRLYWSFEPSREIVGTKCIQIEKESFYILRSKELIALPAGIAVYCRAIDETIGEMRIHYAGFVHPFFGRDRSDSKLGTPLIFEVRGHDVEVILKDHEKLARLTFYRMAEDCVQNGVADYSDQILELSKFFGKWK